MKPDRIVGIDWSGRIDAAGQRRHIFTGIWTRGEKLRLENGRTREEIAPWLLSLARETPRMVVAIDCCFSFPAWFLREHDCATVFDFWAKANAGLAERWLKREAAGVLAQHPRDVRFWGAPHKRPPIFSGTGLRAMFRETDFDNKIAQSLEGGDPDRAVKMVGITPKSPFQIGGSGSVGTGSLRAMPLLLQLHQAGFRVWPFQSAALGNAAKPAPLLLEIYTRLMTGRVAKSNPEARARYLRDKRREDTLYAQLPPKVLRTAAASEDALDALATTIELLRHADDFASLRATRNPTLKLEGITWRPGV